MNTKDAIRSTLGTSEMVLDSYVKDLDDADLLVRPVEGMNHIAWQLGHLIASERRMVEMIQPGACPPLPEGFDEGHGRDQHGLDDPVEVPAPRAVSIPLPGPARGDPPGPRRALRRRPRPHRPRALPPFAPTVGALLNLCGSHVLMHVGQFVAVRRKLGRPIAI